MDEETARKLNLCRVLYFDRIFALKTLLENFFIYVYVHRMSVNCVENVTHLAKVN
jgi:hypothetical protein